MSSQCTGETNFHVFTLGGKNYEQLRTTELLKRPLSKRGFRAYYEFVETEYYWLDRNDKVAFLLMPVNDSPIGVSAYSNKPQSDGEKLMLEKKFSLEGQKLIAASSELDVYSVGPSVGQMGYEVWDPSSEIKVNIVAELRRTKIQPAIGRVGLSQMALAAY